VVEKRAALGDGSVGREHVCAVELQRLARELLRGTRLHVPPVVLVEVVELVVDVHVLVLPPIVVGQIEFYFADSLVHAQLVVSNADAQHLVGSHEDGNSNRDEHNSNSEER